MQCERCHKQPATVHFTQVENGQVRKLHLCETCAEAAGFDMQGPVSITDLLMGMQGLPVQEQQREPRAEDRTCSQCGLKRSEFQKTGRLGCAGCFEVFKDVLSPLLMALHHEDQHVGKVPARQDATLHRATRLTSLQKALAAAVAAEQYEEAAGLRDRIRRLQSSSEADEAESGS